MRSTLRTIRSAVRRVLQTLRGRDLIFRCPMRWIGMMKKTLRTELDHLIARFRDAQDIAVQCIIHVLKFPLPKTCLKWVEYCDRHDVYPLRHRNGVNFYAHGYGIELQVEGLSIDFDFGPNGEPDGFDAWRLYRFAETNAAGVRCTHAQAKQWIEEAHGEGELIQIGNLYFDPKRRAR